MTTATNPYFALVRRLEMTLARQKNAIMETQLQLEAANAMRDTWQQQLPLVDKTSKK